MGAVYTIPKFTGNIVTFTGLDYNSLSAEELNMFLYITEHGLFYANGEVYGVSDPTHYYTEGYYMATDYVYVAFYPETRSDGAKYVVRVFRVDKSATLINSWTRQNIGDTVKYYSTVTYTPPVGISDRADIISELVNAVEGANIELYSNYSQARDALINYSGSNFPITYRMTNATHTGPAEAAVGDNVEVPLSFPIGYGIANPSTDAYVTNNGVLIPSQYANGKLTFTMPDPS